MPAEDIHDDSTDRALTDVRPDAAPDAGFKIAVPCRVCGTYLVAAESVRHRIGPKCREKISSVREAG